MAAELAPSSKRNRTRSPAYPYLDLPAALEKAAVLWRAEGRHAASVSVVMQHWGYKEESSTGYSCVAALKKFGLVDHGGMGETRQVRLSNLALGILLDDDPQSAERRAALREAALGPRIHAELWERYGVELPSDQTLRRFLVLERSFNEASVDELLAEYKQTMAFAGMIRAGGGSNGSNGTPAGLALATEAAATVQGAFPANLTPAAGQSPAAEPSRELRPPPPPPPRVQQTSLPPRAIGPAAVARPVPSEAPAAPATRAQRGLFDEQADPAPPPAAPADMQADKSGPNGSHDSKTPWSIASRELPVPLDNDLVARVPYPMSEEDFALLIDTLQLWKKRLVQSPAR